MVNPREGGVLDKIQAFLAAIIRMRAPIHIRQEAGRVAKPLFLGGFLEMRGFHEVIGPGAKILGVARRAEKS